MKRRLVNLLTLLSLLLCVAVAVLWVRSYFRSDVVGLDGPDGLRMVRSAHGRLRFLRLAQRNRPPVFDDWEWTYAVEAPQRLSDARPGWAERYVPTPVFTLASAQTPQTVGVAFLQVTVPWWALCSAAALLPGLRGATATGLRRRRRTRGLCVRCGYDLRATPGRCPECGTAARAKPATRSTS